MSNLNVLNAAENEITFDQRSIFINTFIGALSSLVAPEDWEMAIESAQNCVKRCFAEEVAR